MEKVEHDGIFVSNNDSTHSQRILFGKDDCSNLLTLFNSELKLKLETVPLTLVNIWKVVCDTIFLQSLFILLNKELHQALLFDGATTLGVSDCMFTTPKCDMAPMMVCDFAFVLRVSTTGVFLTVVHAILRFILMLKPDPSIKAQLAK
ncbi:hypothetical protein PHYBLDRAFT_172010 [Phycomyces blakesleeanus NRRL 1555(-)]|uniref:Uncharacterized protein n=1 Tax=Phycomyces blakesleeanus (strain ATCC 8743b / DSM 1359 / FGSC 10004 / NBRC 33097 / NRRL 1555) TaxID=763407 RepID=A0A162PLC6_PHYB8|nr:hypothetical protein PHYBLDRAFT_172010 [Phycomyces blakesleeanus NRRL 1555(-)]OAD69996.1 hypothetical protein PHYBLDRAFT_172010 [Phycomyces blakesleeanus NRRL 1555(-)]|eukprot:XP_018288036.1 hypothetical protein PHYBLDRAFT_172010 [Phycomyces blakesleeanus NRRL 1555(-)]